MDKAYRSIVKTLSWRTTATLTTIIISYIITGETALAFKIGGIEVFAKMFLYYGHERAWDRSKFGKIDENEGIDYNI